MDDAGGYPYFRKPPYVKLYISTQWSERRYKPYFTVLAFRFDLIRSRIPSATTGSALDPPSVLLVVLLVVVLPVV